MIFAYILIIYGGVFRFGAGALSAEDSTSCAMQRINKEQQTLVKQTSHAG